ncbi:MAG: cytochrome c biosis protein CcsA [Bacteroidota bacterium]|jgi:heme exporter protein C
MAQNNTKITGLGWKLTGVLLLIYSFYQGFMGKVPTLDILNESIRNLYFHVPMWFGMTALLAVSMFFAIRYLVTNNAAFDNKSNAFASVGMLMGILGILTGSVWAKNTWGTFWTNDAKLNGAAISLLIYSAYFILRSSFEDEQNRARISAVYNIFAFAILIPLLFILPRMVSSLHPGNGGNAGFNAYDLDNNMRIVFYPAVIAWIIIGTWVSTLVYRTKTVEKFLNEEQNV